MQPHLHIEHAPFIAPRLDFFDAAPVTFGDAQFHKAKRVVGKTRIVQAHPIATMRLKIGKNLALDEFNENRFRCRIRRRRRFGCRFRCGRSSRLGRRRSSGFRRRRRRRCGGWCNWRRWRGLIAGRNFAPRNWCTRRIALHAGRRRPDRFGFRRCWCHRCIWNRWWRFRFRVVRWRRGHNRRCRRRGTGRGFRASDGRA